MPQPPKTKPETVPEGRDPQKEDSWEDDQEKRGYYYDDAHGYENYEPEEDEEAEART